MRTTIQLEDHLFRSAKEYAACYGTTLTKMIEDALREVLNRRQNQPTKPFQLITFGEGGLQPGVDLDDTAALLNLMDDNDPF